MAINFARKKLCSTITSSQVSADGHGPLNLLAEDRAGIGFRVEYFIKPPVEVVVEFSHPVDIFLVRLENHCGPHQIEALELLASDTTTARVFKSVSKVQNISGKEMIFKNECYRARGSFPSRHHQEDCFRMQGRVLNFTRALTIRINRMKGSGVPGFKNLGIYGQPSLACPSSTRKRIYDLAFESDPKEEPKESPVPQVEEVVEKDDIPEDFLDAITCEMMQVPMLLPSGHSVDRSTLERLMGRDPFTGLLFTSTYRPLPHCALKVRMDAYLVRVASHLPRRLGSEKSQSSRPLAGNPTWATVRAQEESCSEGTTERQGADGGPIGDHQECLDRSLEDSLKDVMSRIRSRKRQTRKCSSCSQFEEIMYSLPCSHLLCRPCLLSFGRLDFECATCGVTVNSREVTRSHP